ncbi:hypothetical protein [Gramella sp. AN32]|uniref:Polymer-forming cytoskeletal protein n=1 Tax=Christiangramia antarctica TaxID=2058158 RepID=A0ABW5X3N8_9FLAO|nr:hypothetical protein [Gramella sp. AN32]MCM4154879.1 hypothetical protein [Gramella sp. AN32]
MKIKTIGFLLIASIFIVSCDKSAQDYDETPEQELFHSHKDPQTGVEGKWHRGPEGTVWPPPEETGLIKDLVDCGNTVHYKGKSSLIIPPREVQSYHGLTSLKNLKVQGKLNFCGDLTVENTISVNSTGSINIGVGTLTAADLRIGYGSHLNVENAAIIVNGDLILDDGAMIEFFGDHNSLEVRGEVIKHGQVDVAGSFTDVSKKL